MPPPMDSPPTWARRRRRWSRRSRRSNAQRVKEYRVGRPGRLAHLGGDPHAPSRRRPQRVHALSRMIRRQDGLLALLVEAEDAERGDQGCGAAAGQADPLAPAGAVAVAGRGAVADALDEAVPRLRHDDDDAPGEAGDVRAPAAPRPLAA